MRVDDNPSKSEAYCFPIVRCRPKNPLCVTLLQDKVSGIWTHFWNGKTIACTGPVFCDACKENVKETWAGYIIARRHEDDQKVICAVTKPTMGELNTMKDLRGGLFGLRIRLIRMGRKTTSPVKVECFGRDKDEYSVPKGVMETIILRLYADNANKKTIVSR